jgi:tripartite-type tricarboxylate transporter receptor subunit TctC
MTRVLFSARRTICSFVRLVPARSDTPRGAFPPGGSNDVIARAIAPQLAKRLGSNRHRREQGRRGGRDRIRRRGKAPPDGSQLLLTSSTFLTTAATQAKLPYDPIRRVHSGRHGGRRPAAGRRPG